PIAVTWHAGTFYAAIEVMEAAGAPFPEIKLEHAADRFDGLLSGPNQAAALVEPPGGRAPAAGGRHTAELPWRGGVVAAGGGCGGGHRRGDREQAAARAQPRDRMAARERGALTRGAFARLASRAA